MLYSTESAAAELASLQAELLSQLGEGSGGGGGGARAEASSEGRPTDDGGLVSPPPMHGSLFGSSGGSGDLGGEELEGEGTPSLFAPTPLGVKTKA